ncbi:hypothetical protein FACS1894133_5250 [Clostridia bacterium]|nr:hypothetical protein FACS1894133_5250 [Clostridia bacterium]
MFFFVVKHYNGKLYGWEEGILPSSLFFILANKKYTLTASEFAAWQVVMLLFTVELKTNVLSVA